MRILFFTRRFYPQIGGVETHVMEIAKSLVKNGHKVIIVTENIKDSNLKNVYFSDSEIINDIEIIRIKVGKENWLKKFRIWKKLLGLHSVINSADIVHCHDVFFWYFPFRFYHLNKMVYITFHGYESFPITKKAIIVRKISEKLSKGNICIGEFIAKWYGAKPNVISYGGVNTKHVTDTSKVKQDSALFYGRLDKQTGIDIYIKAFMLIKKKFPKFHFLVIGEGNYRRFIPNMVKVRSFTEFPQAHFVNYNFVFVSRYLSILEALAAKKIVIATYDNPVKKDYLIMSPFSKYIYICKNAKEVVDVVESVMKYPWKSNSMLENGYNWANDQTWEKVADVYLGLWQENLTNV